MLTHADRTAALSEPMLDEDSQRALLAAYRDTGDRRAADRITKAYARIAYSEAAAYSRDQSLQLDLVQDGLLGILYSARTYDESKGKSFAGWCRWHVRSHIESSMNRNLSRHGMTFYRGASEIAETAAEIRKSLSIMSMDMPLGDGEDDGVLSDLIADDGPTPEAMVAEREARTFASAAIEMALSELSPSDADVIRARMQGQTFRQIADRIGTTHQAAHTLEKRIWNRMRHALERRGITGSAA